MVGARMRRGWVKGPRGEYLLVVGTPRFRDLIFRFQWSGNDLMSPTDPFGAAAAWTQHLFRHGTRRGYVAVHAFGRHWAWVLPKGRDPQPVGDALERMIASGEWVPESMPPPKLPGARRYAS